MNYLSFFSRGRQRCEVVVLLRPALRNWHNTIQTAEAILTYPLKIY